MAWVAKRLRGAKVWVECDAGGQPLGGEDQRASVLYRKGGKRYRAALRNLLPDDDLAVLSDAEMSPGEPVAEAAETPSAGATGSLFGSPAGGTKPAGPLLGSPVAAGPHAAGLHTAGLHAARPAAALATGAFHVYTDGACTGNPGPMGLGVVILDLNGTPTRRELSEYLGMGTNNIAELTAILRGLEVLPRDRPVVIYSDSAYAIGLLSQNWKAKANQELVARLRLLLREFPAVRFVKVAGHAGVPENERCDELARNAITNPR